MNFFFIILLPIQISLGKIAHCTTAYVRDKMRVVFFFILFIRSQPALSKWLSRKMQVGTYAYNFDKNTFPCGDHFFIAMQKKNKRKKIINHLRIQLNPLMYVVVQ